MIRIIIFVALKKNLLWLKHSIFSLTNAKTSFAAGFGLHHWSILEGELAKKQSFATPAQHLRCFLLIV